MIRRLVIAAATIGMVGCASLANSIAPLRTEVSVSDDSFEQVATIRGIESRHRGGVYNKQFIRSWINKKTGEVTHQLYVTDYYGGDWKFWERASGDGGIPLEVTTIARDVESCTYGSCTFSEVFGAAVPDSLLAAHRDSGYAVKFSARSGDELIVELSPLQISEQMDAVAAYRRAHDLGRGDDSANATGF